MLNNDYIKGYVMALETLDSTLDEWKKEIIHSEKLQGYEDVQFYIETQKNNYKKLVKDLNESQSKKTT